MSVRSGDHKGKQDRPPDAGKGDPEPSIPEPPGLGRQLGDPSGGRGEPDVPDGYDKPSPARALGDPSGDPDPDVPDGYQGTPFVFTDEFGRDYIEWHYPNGTRSREYI